jgi:hypothetical protein
MGRSKISFAILNFDELFANTPDATLIPCTLRSAGSKTMDEHIQGMFMKSSELSFAASCDCGKLVGNFYMGSTCPSCRSIVRKNFSNKLNYQNWIEIPKPLPPVLHPGVFQILLKWLGRTQQGHLLKLLMSADNKLPDKLRGTLGCGMDYFHKNFTDIINWLATNYRPSNPNKKSTKQSLNTDEVLAVLEKYKDRLFIQHIPVLSSTFHLVEESGTLAYVDDASGPILKAKLELTNAIYILNHCPNNQQVLDRHMYEFYMSYLDYVDKISYTKLMKKKGFIRKRNMGSRVHNSFRAVVVPIVGEHMGDEIHIPWKVGVTNLKMEILNVLQNRMGMSMSEILSRYHQALVNYDPLIDQVMETLLKECPFKGFPVFFGRNPDVAC